MSRTERLSMLDILSAVGAALVACALVAFPFVIAPSFSAMYRDFDTTLPLATRTVLAPWPAPLAGVLLGALVAFALRREDALRRRLLLAASAVIACAAIPAAWWALYLPLYALTGAITAE